MIGRQRTRRRRTVTFTLALVRSYERRWVKDLDFGAEDVLGVKIKISLMIFLFPATAVVIR